VLSPYNARKKAPGFIEELAASIYAQGLEQNLVVHALEGARGKETIFGVCAGQRRLAALQYLLGEGKIPEAYPVLVRIVEAAEALDISVTENRHREEMHVADLAIACVDLLAAGRDIGYAAMLLGCNESAVKRHVKLATLSPKLMDVFRADEMSYEQAATLVLGVDHEMQERLWFDAQQPWQREPRHLRDAIIGDELDVRTSGAVRFVGIEAYEEAGGHVRRDLFSGDDAGYIGDIELLNTLVADKLAMIAEPLRAEGWQWVEARPLVNHIQRQGYGLLSPQTRELTVDEQARHDVLAQRLTEANDALDAYYDSDCEADEALEASLRQRASTIEAEMQELQSTCKQWTPEQKDQSGVLVTLDQNGNAKIERGLIARESTSNSTMRGVPPNAFDERVQQPAKAKPVHSETLCRRVTAHRTAAVQVELAASPKAAVAVLLQKMVPGVFAGHFMGYFDTGLQVQTTCSHKELLRSADDLANGLAWREIEAQRRAFEELLPTDRTELFPWLLGQSEQFLSHLLAFCVAACLDSVSGDDRRHGINDIADALQIDYATYWQPTAKSYFDHVSKARIGEVIGREVSAEEAVKLGKMKKADAAKMAEALMTGKRWLPVLLTRDETPGAAEPSIDRNDACDVDDAPIEASVPITDHDHSGSHLELSEDEQAVPA
jgi:ParB family chromosome partitioning protein